MFWTTGITDESIARMMQAVEIEDFHGMVSLIPDPENVRIVGNRLAERAGPSGMGIVLYNSSKTRHWYWALDELLKAEVDKKVKRI